MKTGNIISAIAASLLLAACGGSDTPSTTDSSTLSNKVLKGYYVDSAVEGVEFNCTTASGATQSGTTDENGTFTFEENQTCTFKIGDVVLREVNASSLEDKVTVFEDNTRVAQFLQTLDSDGNASNGIQILPEAHELVKERNMTEVPQNDAELEDVKDDLTEKAPERYHGDIVSEQDAREHLSETRQRIETHNQRTQDDVEATREAGRERAEEAHSEGTQTRDANEERASDREEMSAAHEDSNQTREAREGQNSGRDTMNETHEDATQPRDANEERASNRESNQERTAEQEAMRESHEDVTQPRDANEERASDRESNQGRSAEQDSMNETHEDATQTRDANEDRASE